MYYYGARYYDPRLSLWMSTDPLQEKYLNISTYCYTANNPVKSVDTDGRKIVGITKKDAETFQKDLYEIFSADRFQAFRSLLKLKRRSFVKIDAKALQSILESEDLSDDDKALIRIVSNTINSKRKHTVEYYDEKVTSRRGIKILSPAAEEIGIDVEKTLKKHHGFSRAFIENRGGEGITGAIKKGSHSIIDSRATNRSAMSAHEVFGHGRALSLGHTTAEQHLDAIQLENMVYRVMGISIVLDGSTHGSREILQNASDIPTQLISK